MALRWPLAVWLRTPLQKVPFAPALTCSSHDQDEGSDFRSQYAIARFLTLRLEGPIHQGGDGVVDAEASGDDGGDRLRDRHVHSGRAGEIDQHARRERALRQRSEEHTSELQSQS